MKSACAAVFLVFAVPVLTAQDRLRSMPGYDQYQRMAPQIAGSWMSGAVVPRWNADGRSFSYSFGGTLYRFDVGTMSTIESSDAPAHALGRGRAAAPGPLGPPAGRGLVPQNGGQSEMTGRVDGCPPALIARGRQSDCAVSPNHRLKAFYRDRNVWLANVDGLNERALTTDGSEQTRVKYGTASWVYGEELGQTTAIWWSPDGTKVGFYRFDESHVKDFYLQTDQTEVQDSIDVEAYPKAGAPNPVADVLVYDVATGRTLTIDVRDGQPPANDVLGYYVSNIRWLPDSRELILNRSNRRQQVLELNACSVTTGKCRVLVHESWPTGWLNTDSDKRMSPSASPRWLADGRRFIWESERTGWKNYYLYDLGGRLIAPLTANAFEAVNIVKIDEAAGLMFYTARDGDNFLEIQLHRVGLDGKGDVRLTDPQFTHSIGICPTGAPAAGCGIAPDNRHIVDVYQRHDVPPAAQVLDDRGRAIAQVTKSDLTRYERLGFRKTEQFSYTAADGVTTLYGQISFPSNFDPSKKYPSLLPVYGGPALAANVPTENFVGPIATAEYGFLVLSVGYRGAPGTGKRAADALYMKLGQTEIDDMALGVKALWDRPYFDKARVGIYGTSYGGYAAAMEIVRHPEVFSAASASSSVTDWRNYDSIYTERYMWLPDENRAGYDAGSVMTYAANLKGRLLLYYGTADNNVHPTNSLQLIHALQQANKSVEVQVGPDQPHSAVNPQRMMEFFIENLISHPERLTSQ